MTVDQFYRHNSFFSVYVQIVLLQIHEFKRFITTRTEENSDVPRSLQYFSPKLFHDEGRGVYSPVTDPRYKRALA